MEQMGLTRRDVLTAIARAEVDYPGSGGHPGNRRIACFRRLAVVYERAGRGANVLWRGIEFVRPGEGVSVDR